MTHERTRLPLALLFSLLIHALLFSLTFGGQALGLTGFALRFPWQDRRVEAPDLRVVLVPVQVKAPEAAITPNAEPLQQGQTEQPVVGGFALTPPASPALTPRRTTAAIVAGTHSSERVNPRPGTASGAAPAKTPLRAVRPGGTAPPPVPETAVIASARSDEPTWVVPVTPAVPTPVIPTAPSASSSETAMPPLRDTANEARAQIDEEARERAVEQVGLDRARQDARRQAEQMEAARQEAERLAAAQQEVARQESEQQAAAQQEAARQEAERQAAAQQEVARQEAEQQAAARQEAARKGDNKSRQEATTGGSTGRSGATGGDPAGVGATGGRTPGGSATSGSQTRGGGKTGSAPSGDRTTTGRGSRPA